MRLAVESGAQRQRRVEGLGGQGPQGGTLGRRHRADCLQPPRDVAGVSGAVGRREQRVEFGQARYPGHRHEVAPAQAPDLALHATLLVGAARGRTSRSRSGNVGLR